MDSLNRTIDYYQNIIKEETQKRHPSYKTMYECQLKITELTKKKLTYLAYELKSDIPRLVRQKIDSVAW